MTWFLVALAFVVLGVLVVAAGLIHVNDREIRDLKTKPRDRTP